jgi:hypothetical protein
MKKTSLFQKFLKKEMNEAKDDNKKHTHPHGSKAKSKSKPSKEGEKRSSREKRKQKRGVLDKKSMSHDKIECLSPIYDEAEETISGQTRAQKHNQQFLSPEDENNFITQIEGNNHPYSPSPSPSPLPHPTPSPPSHLHSSNLDPHKIIHSPNKQIQSSPVNPKTFPLNNKKSNNVGQQPKRELTIEREIKNQSPTFNFDSVQYPDSELIGYSEQIPGMFYHSFQVFVANIPLSKLGNSYLQNPSDVQNAGGISSILGPLQQSILQGITTQPQLLQHLQLEITKQIFQQQQHIPSSTLNQFSQLQQLNQLNNQMLNSQFQQQINLQPGLNPLGGLNPLQIQSLLNQMNTQNRNQQLNPRIQNYTPLIAENLQSLHNEKDKDSSELKNMNMKRKNADGSGRNESSNQAIKTQSASPELKHGSREITQTQKTIQDLIQNEIKTQVHNLQIERTVNSSPPSRSHSPRLSHQQSPSNRDLVNDKSRQYLLQIDVNYIYVQI